MALVYQVAREAASEVRREYANHNGPLTFESLRTIAMAMGASVHVTDLPRNESGMIIKYAGSQPRIYISATDSKERQLFTLAHELGHLWERREVARDEEYSFTDKRNGDSNLHEFFANEFAGALLMPTVLLKESKNASEIGVSEKALEERERRLAVHPE